MIIRLATPDDVVFVCSHLRAHNAREIAAVRWSDDPTVLAKEILAAEPRCIRLEALCIADGLLPAVLAGAWLKGPGLAQVCFLATDEWPAIARVATRYLRQSFIPAVLGGLRRAETVVLDVPEHRRWLKFLGFTVEGLAPAYGKRGEDFAHVAWVHPCWRAGNGSAVDAAAAGLAFPGTKERRPHV